MNVFRRSSTSRMVESIGHKVWSCMAGQFSIREDTIRSRVKTILDRLDSKGGRMPRRQK